MVSGYDDYKVIVLFMQSCYSRIDPLLIKTVIMQDTSSIYEKQDELKQFLTNGKPVKYYAQHIKNLAIFGTFSQHKEINCILAICTGVKNLVLQTLEKGFEKPSLRSQLMEAEHPTKAVLPAWINASLLSPLFHQHNTPSPLGWQQ